MSNDINVLPESFGNLIQLDEFYAFSNHLTNLPNSINNFNPKHLYGLELSSYQINNLDISCETLIISYLNIGLSNLPIGLSNLPIGLKKLILLSPKINIDLLKIPFDCEVIVI